MGLITGSYAANNQAQTPETPPEQSAHQGEDGKLNLDPQQQAQLDLISQQASDYILTNENTDNLVSMAKKDPVAAISEMATAVLTAIYSAASRAGKTISQELLGIAGTQIALLFAAVLANEGVIELSQIMDVSQKAYDLGLSNHNAKFEQQGMTPQSQGQPPAPGV